MDKNTKNNPDNISFWQELYNVAAKEGELYKYEFKILTIVSN